MHLPAAHVVPAEGKVVRYITGTPRCLVQTCNRFTVAITEGRITASAFPKILLIIVVIGNC